MARRKLSSDHRYIRFGVSPPSTNTLALRKLMQDALAQSFGLVSSHTYIDILSLSEDGTSLVVRIGENEAPKLLAAVTASTALPRLSLVKESHSLPAVLPAGSIA